MATVARKVSPRVKRPAAMSTKTTGGSETMAQMIKKFAAKAKRSAMEAYDKVETKVKEIKGRRRTKARIERVKTVGKRVAKAALAAGAVAAAAATIREIRDSRR